MTPYSTASSGRVLQQMQGLRAAAIGTPCFAVYVQATFGGLGGSPRMLSLPQCRCRCDTVGGHVILYGACCSHQPRVQARLALGLRPLARCALARVGHMLQWYCVVSQGFTVPVWDCGCCASLAVVQHHTHLQTGGRVRSGTRTQCWSHVAGALHGAHGI